MALAHSAGDTAIGIIVGVVLVALFLALYFVPSMFAWANKESDFRRVLLVNAVLGWTSIGWVVALVMANRRTQDPTVSDEPAPGWYPQPDGSNRWWDGAAWAEHSAPPP
jgi:hypothetical protein